MAGNRQDPAWMQDAPGAGHPRKQLWGYGQNPTTVLLLRAATLGKKDVILGVWRRLFVELLLLGESITGLWS